MYDTLDVHGGSTAIPTWMTEPHWKDLRITDQPKVPLQILQKLHALLKSQSFCSNGNGNSYGGQGNDGKNTTNTSATAEVEKASSKRGNTSGVDTTTSEAITPNTSK